MVIKGKKQRGSKKTRIPVSWKAIENKLEREQMARRLVLTIGQPKLAGNAKRHNIRRQLRNIRGKY